MNMREIYKGLSSKLVSDFEISSQIEHNGDLGTFREGSLRKFLLDERLPNKYSIGHGQIISQKNDVSKSVDLVVYDHVNNIPLLYDQNTQIFPIEAVYGIIECKSALSKEKLLEGLENIKSVKQIAPQDNTSNGFPGFITSFKLDVPFGIIFAYKLGGNSLDSLEKNLREWESSNDIKVWPNMIVVLNEGIITHCNEFSQKILFDKYFSKSLHYSSVSYKEETLFHFYISLLDLCSSVTIGNFRLENYFNLPDKIGSYYVKGNDRWRSNNDGAKVRLNESFIDRVYKECIQKEKIPYGDFLRKTLGTIPEYTEKIFDINHQVYLYDPDNLPGFHEIKNPITFSDKAPVVTERMLIPFFELEINEEYFFIPQAYLCDSDFEKC